jgi:hypothetical protein
MRFEGRDGKTWNAQEYEIDSLVKIKIQETIKEAEGTGMECIVRRVATSKKIRFSRIVEVKVGKW